MDSQPTVNVVLVAPEIPQNTGNLIRLCANVGAHLHLVEPLGFQLNSPRLRRASLDYSDIVETKVHNSIQEYLDTVCIDSVYGAVVSGSVPYTKPNYKPGDTIVFGSESVGLSKEVVKTLRRENRVHIPMMPANRSLNLSNAAAIIVYEMWKQIGFSGTSNDIDQPPSYFS